MTINAGNGVRDYYFGETPLVITDNFTSFVYNTGFFVYVANGKADFYIGEIASLVDRFSITTAFLFKESVSPADVFNIYSRIQFSETQPLTDLIKQLNLFAQYSERISLLDVIHTLQISMSEAETITPTSVFNLSLRVDFSESQTAIDLFKSLSLFINYSETSTLTDIFKVNYITTRYYDSLSGIDIARLKTFQSFSESLTESEKYLFELFLSFSESISQSDVFKVDTIRVFYSEDFTIRDKVTIQTDVTYREILSSLIDRYSIGLFIRFSENVSPVDLLKDLNLNLSYSESVTAIEEDYIAFSDLHLIVAGGLSDFFIGEQQSLVDVFKQVSLFVKQSESVSLIDVAEFKVFVEYSDSFSEADLYKFSLFTQFSESQSLLDYIKSVSLVVKYADSISATDVARLKSFQLFQESLSEVDRFNLDSFIKFAESGNLIDVFKSVRLTTFYSEVVSAIDVLKLKAILEFSEEITESDRFNLESFIKFTESLSASDVFKSVNLSLNYSESLTLVDVTYIAFSNLHLIVSGGISDFFIGENSTVLDVFKTVNLTTSYDEIVSLIDVAEFKTFLRYSDEITETDRFNLESFIKFDESVSAADVFKSVSLSILKSQTIPSRDVFSVFISGIRFSDSITEVDIAEFKVFLEFYESLSSIDRMTVDKVFTQYSESPNLRDFILLTWENFDSEQVGLLDEIKFLFLNRSSDSMSGIDVLNIFLKTEQLESISPVDIADVYTSNIGVIVGNGNQDYFITDIPDIIDRFESASLEIQYSDSFSALSAVDVFLKVNYSDALSFVDLYNVNLFTQFSETFPIKSKFNISLQDRYTDILDVLKDSVSIVTGLYFSDEFSSILDKIEFLWTLSNNEVVSVIDVIKSELQITFDEIETATSDFVIAFSLEGVIAGNGNQVDFIGENVSLDETFNILSKILYTEEFSPVDVSIFKNFSSYSEFINSVDIASEIFREIPAESLRMYDGWIIFYPLDFSESFSSLDLFQTALKTKFSDGVVETETFSVKTGRSFVDSIPVLREFYHFALKLGFSEEISAEDLFTILSKQKIEEVVSVGVSIDFVLNKLISELFVILDNFNVFIRINFDEKISASDVYSRFSSLVFSEQQTYKEKFRPKFTSIQRDRVNATDVERDVLVVDVDESVSLIETLNTHSVLSFSEKGGSIEGISVDFYSLFKESMEALDLEKGQFVFEENEKSGWHDPIQINLAVSYFETHEIVDVASVVSIYPYYQQIISLFESYGLSDIVLVHDIKSVDYSRETPVVIIPKNFEVKEVFNGYVTDITMEVIIATPDEEQFAEMKSSMKRVISNSSFSYNLPLIWVKSQSYDPNPKGLYREFYIVNVKSYQPKVVV